MLYTSGTTGPPKGAVIPRRAVAATLDALARSAWGMLSPEEQKAMGGEYITFLEDARQRAQDQIDAGTKMLVERERALVNAVDLDVVKVAATITMAWPAASTRFIPSRMVTPCLPWPHAQKQIPLT